MVHDTRTQDERDAQALKELNKAFEKADTESFKNRYEHEKAMIGGIPVTVTECLPDGVGMIVAARPLDERVEKIGITKAAMKKSDAIINEINTKDTNPKDLVGQTKLQTWLVPPSAKIALAEALTDGANKYGPFNWREKGVRATVYIAAAERHVMSFLDGEDLAEDSGVHHLAHAMACFAILLDAIAQGNIVDDRPIKGASPALLKAIHLKNEEKNKAK